MRTSHSTPEPRSITPVKPFCKARSGDTTPMPTVRCFQMRLSVSSVSSVSIFLGKRSQNASIKSSILPSRDALSSFNTFALRYLLVSYLGIKSGKSRYTPPTRKYAACMRAPDTASYKSINSSRSRNAYKIAVIAPISSACEPTPIKWFKIRVTSANMVRMYLARIGTSKPSSFSIAKQ